MFTGIVEEVGRIRRVERRADVIAVEIEAARVTGDLPIGGSIAVAGCCLTAVRVEAGAFSCELTPETLARTRFGMALSPGAAVNLERPLRADGRFDGHIVQGHVDAVGRVASMASLGESAELAVTVPDGLERYLVLKGSVAVDGVSLTVARLERATFTIALIPFTLAQTSLRDLRAGDAVNIELDVLAKYVERMLSWREAGGAGS
jgi:riboflavin synthase